MFTKIFKVNRKSDEASQALAICTHGVAGAKYFELPLDPASPCNVVLGTKPKVVFFGATQADVQTNQALSVLHPWISQAYAYYLIYKHDYTASVSHLRSLGRRAFSLAPSLAPMPSGGAVAMGGSGHALVAVSSTLVPAHGFSGAPTRSPSQVQKVSA